MIADLKADSERWEAERRATASRGQPTNGIPFRDSDCIVRKSNTTIVEYRASTTHQSRQYYGPTEAAPGAQMSYQAAAATATQPQVYDSSAAGYPQQSYAQPSAQYAQPSTGYAGQESNYYVAGADMAVDQRSSSARIPVSQTQPRNVQYPTSSSTYPSAQQDSRAMYYSQQSPSGVAVTSAQYSTQPTDPYYGRGAYNHQPSP
jgi:hypothetical protein